MDPQNNVLWLKLILPAGNQSIIRFASAWEVKDTDWSRKFGPICPPRSKIPTKNMYLIATTQQRRVTFVLVHTGLKSPQYNDKDTKVAVVWTLAFFFWSSRLSFMAMLVGNNQPSTARHYRASAGVFIQIFLSLKYLLAFC